MDTFYNKTEAVRYLEDVFEERNSNPNSPQMYGMTPEAVDGFKLSIAKEDLDAASKLVKQDEETQELEEATVAVQGILCKAMLPPFDLKISRSERLTRLQHIRQSITLTGLGSKGFDKLLDNCRRTYTMFSRYTPKARLIPVPEFIGSIEVTNDSGSSIAHPSIVASNRLFTPAKQASGLDPIEISSEMDPRGVLAKVDQSRWIHTEDNEVVYYILAEDGSCVPTSPIVFQIGDIVEAQVSMLCVPHKGDYTVKLILRSLLLLSGRFTTEATTARTLLVAAAASKPPPRRLKRRNVYAAASHSRKTTSASKGRIDAEEDYSELLEPTGEQVHDDFEDGGFDELAEPTTDNVREAGVYGMLTDA